MLRESLTVRASTVATLIESSSHPRRANAGHRRTHVRDHQGEGLEAARPGRGPRRDARLQLPEAAGVAAERQEGHRRRRHGQEAPADAVLQARAVGRQARHPGPPGARRRPRGPRPHRAGAQERRADRASGLDTQVTELEAQQEKLTDSEQKLRQKIDAFRTKKEVIKAQYSAAEAQVRISEAATGVGEQMADVGLAMQRATDKTEQMRARADAVSELEAAGTFDDLTAARARPGRHRPPARGALQRLARSTPSSRR